MELANECWPALERGDERSAVRGPSRHPTRRALTQGIGVRERRDARGYEPRFRLGRDAVPTEMWDPHMRWQPATRSRDDTEPGHARRLVTRVTQQLHAETDAE